MRKPLTDEQKQVRLEYQRAWRKSNKERLAEWYREYRKQHPEKNKANTKAYRERHPERAKESSKKYKCNNREKIKQNALDYQPRKAELHKLKKETDPVYKLKCLIRSNILKSFTRINMKKTNKTLEILGCTYEEFRNYIESKFESWMTWDNYGKYNGDFSYGWDLDHIIPIASAITGEDVIGLNHYTNFQPLCSHINRNIKKDNPTY